MIYYLEYYLLYSKCKSLLLRRLDSETERMLDYYESLPLFMDCLDFLVS